MKWKYAHKKSKIMTTSKNISADISMNGPRIEDVTSFKYLGATLRKNVMCNFATYLVSLSLSLTSYPSFCR